MTFVEFAVVREANKIRTTFDYRPEGYRETLRWADAIISGEEYRPAPRTGMTRHGNISEKQSERPPLPPARSLEELDRQALEWLERRRNE